MAEGGESEVLKCLKEDFLQCSICMEQYKDPRILNCLHSFCSPCIKQHVGRSKDIKCPMCNQTQNIPNGGIEKLKSNFYIKGLMEQIVLSGDKKKENTKTCTSCNSGLIGSSFCEDCGRYICCKCEKAHKEIAVLKTHKVTPIKGKKDKSPSDASHFKYKKKIQQKLSEMDTLAADNKAQVERFKKQVEDLEEKEKGLVDSINISRQALVDHIQLYSDTLIDKVKENTRLKLGNKKDVIKLTESRLETLGRLKNQAETIEEVHMKDKVRAYEQLLDQMKELKDQMKNIPEYRWQAAEDVSFVDAEPDYEEREHNLKRLIGFLKPQPTRDERHVKEVTVKMSKNMLQYAIHCAHTAIDKYGNYPRNNTTLNNMSLTICDMFEKRYNRNEWSCVVTTDFSCSLSIEAKCTIIEIEDLEIWFMKHE